MENIKEPVTQTDDKTEVTVTEPVTKTDTDVKTFTQEEVNAMVLKETSKINKKYEGIDLEEYKKWQDSKKTEAEKHQELLNENQTLKNKVIELENMSVVANAGVDPKFQKFILSEISKEGNFEDNLKDYLKENPQYLQAKETVEAPKTTGVPVSKINNSEDDGVLAILKAKHPNLNL